MSRGKSWKRGWAAALAAGLVLLGGCAGAPAESAPPEAEPYRVQNDGREARLVLGFIADGSPRAEVLAEIGEKYTAEYPHTQIAVESFDSFAELDSAARQGRVDILEVPGGRQAELVEDGVLLDFSEALFGWEEYAALTPAAKMTAGSMGKGKAYLLMEDFRQLRLYYRADWVAAYNEGLTTGQAYCNTWGQILGGVAADGTAIPGTSEKLGSRGKLAFAGKEELMRLFDLFLWSAVGRDQLEDPAFGYAAGEGSVFQLENAAAGAEQFAQMMTDAALPGVLDFTQEQAVDAFVSGKAGLLLAGREAAETLADSMAPDTWAALPVPRGLNGTAVFSGEYTGWGIRAGTQAPEIAEHFLLFLSDSDNNPHYAVTCGTLPIHMDAGNREPALYNSLIATDLGMLEHTNRYQYAQSPFEAEPATSAAWEAVRDYAQGGCSTAELLAALDGLYAGESPH